MSRRLIPILLYGVLTAGCSHPPAHGTVIDKHYVPGETTYIMLKGVAIPDTSDPCYQLVVRKPDHTVANDCVSETDYYNTPIGASY